MARPEVIIRTANLDDVETIAQVEAESWPTPLGAIAEQVRARLTAYPTGQLVGEMNGAVVGVVFAQRITSEFFSGTPARFDLLTDYGCFTRSHQPEGDIYQIIGVGVGTAGRGLNLGRTLVDRQIEIARSLPGIRRIVGFTRPADYHRHRDVPIEQYVTMRTDHGRYVDRVLAFHLNAGAQLVSIHPGFRPEDSEACGYGVLIEYTL